MSYVNTSLDSQMNYSLEMVAVRLVHQESLKSRKKIEKPEDAIDLLGDVMRELDREAVFQINLATNGQVINASLISMGALNYSMVHPRDFLKSACLSNANATIMLHNHVSGSLEPSKEDCQITDRMSQICSMIGIPLLDHIIIAAGTRDYFSFKEQGIIKQEEVRFKENYKDIVLAQNESLPEMAGNKRRRSR